MSPEISVLLETQDFIAIDKPPGLSVHNDDAGGTNVLQIMGKHLHLAHRLDKETSGILLLAKNSGAAHALMLALGQPSSEKTYEAILRGSLKTSTDTTNLQWAWPISDKAEGRQNPQGKSSERMEALTIVSLLHGNRYFTRVNAVIKTGRQHQIRKHAALAKCPIVGDSRYNDKVYNQKIFQYYDFNRMLLHAAQLRFTFKGQALHIQANAPKIFEELFRDSQADH